MQKTIGIYHSHLCQIGGVETFLYNFCIQLRNYYDITVLYNTGDTEQILRLSKLVNLEQYDNNCNYEYDIVLRNSVWGEIPYNIKSKDNRYIEMRHANYKYLQEKDLLKIQYHKWDKVNEIVACGEFVNQMSREVMKDNPTTIINILAPKEKTRHILKLISCTRIDIDKGWDRMLKMAQMLREAEIKFEWNIFTNNPQECEYEEIHFYKQRFDIWDYLADADYTVLLSNCEGLPYTVQESLQYDTPCIVTDIEGCTELIKDGINGYVVPLDMKFDIKRILKIPKISNYENGAKEKWLNYLGNAKYEEKEIKNMIKIIKARIPFNDIAENKQREANEVWEVSEERAKEILRVDTPQGKLIEIVGVKEDASEESKTEATNTEKQEKSIKKNVKQKDKVEPSKQIKERKGSK